MDYRYDHILIRYGELSLKFILWDFLQRYLFRKKFKKKP